MLIFQFLNNEIHNYVNQKKFSQFDRTRGDKNQIFRTFRHTASLVGHERIHIGQKPYSCQFCKKKFRQLGAWKNHELIHTNEKPFSCEICQKSFRQESSFRRHKVRNIWVFSPLFPSKREKSVLVLPS